MSYDHVHFAHNSCIVAVVVVVVVVVVAVVAVGVEAVVLACHY